MGDTEENRVHSLSKGPAPLQRQHLDKVIDFSVSLVIPCYNEAPRLDRTVREVAAYCQRFTHPFQIVLVDDGSTDATAELITEAAKAHSFVLPVLLPENRGKGAALVHGVLASNGEAVVFFDADLSYPLDTLDAALQELRSGADIVIGARDLGSKSGAAGNNTFIRGLSHVAFSAMVDHYLHLGIPDTQCGFKAFKGSVARALFACLTIERFAFDVELLALARLWGLAIRRLPVVAIQRDGSSVRMVRDSIGMWLAVIQIRRRLRDGAYPASQPVVPG